MNQHEIQSKLTKLKGNILRFVRGRLRYLGEQEDLEEDSNESIDVYMEDLPLTLNREPGPNITFYPTENSKMAKGAPKKIPRGLDRFDEKQVQ